MSHPKVQERKHISDAAWDAVMASSYAAKHAHMREGHEMANEEIGVVMLTVEEHEALWQALRNSEQDKDALD